MKPIERHFRQAENFVCLVNGWRDTAFYGVAGLLCLHPCMHGGQAAHQAVDLFWQAATYREFLRYFGWETWDPPLQTAGMPSPVTVDKKKNAHAARAVACLFTVFLGLYGDADPVTTKLLCGFGVVGAAVSTRFLKDSGARLRDVPDLFFNSKNGMWDFARRKDSGNGPPQTKKVLAWIDAAVQSLMPGRKTSLPAPVFRGGLRSRGRALARSAP